MEALFWFSARGFRFIVAKKKGVMPAGVQSVTVEAWAGCTRAARGGSKELGPEQGLGYSPQTLNSVTHPR